MRVQENHLHAVPVYHPISLAHFWWLFYSVVYGKWHANQSITQHLPFEIEHPDQFSLFGHFFGTVFILYGELLKKVFRVRLYWENSPVLNVGKWDLKYGQTDWGSVPRFINLTVDTGHLMLGARNMAEARQRIQLLFKKRGTQIKHIHLHENDFKTDLHLKPFERKKINRVIDERLFQLITNKRTFIFEDPS